MKNSLFLFLLLISNYSFCCSLIKITHNGKTIVANNEDGSFPNVKMSIEPAEKGKFGVVFFGNNDNYILKTKYSDFFPQGGINEAGLMFDYFSANSAICSETNKKPNINDDLVKGIMKNCSTVYQVRDIFEKYNTCGYGIVFFTDKKGDYLIIDNGRIILGSKSNWVQTNFHPWEKSNCWRYDTASSMINKSYKFSVDFCLNVANAMHQEWSMGGTQYTYIGDLDKGLIYLYYYHDFKKVKIFNIKKELKKGKRIIYIPDLFPDNVKGWENVKAFNKHKTLIERLTDTMVLSNRIKLKEIEDSIINLKKDERFNGIYFNSMELFSNHLCEAGDYWRDRKNYSYSSEIYSFTKKLYPFSWGSYNNLGYLYKEEKEYQLAIENFIICQGLVSNTDYIAEIDSLSERISHQDSLSYKARCGYYYSDDKHFSIIEYKDKKYNAYCGNSIDAIDSSDSRTGKPILDNYIVMDDASVVFSDLRDSLFNKLMFYFSTDKRGYKFQRANYPINSDLKKKYTGRYTIDGDSYIDIVTDNNNYLTINVYSSNVKIDSIIAYPSSATNFIYKFGRLLFLDVDENKFNKIQIYLNNKTIICVRGK